MYGSARHIVYRINPFLLTVESLEVGKMRRIVHGTLTAAVYLVLLKISFAAAPAGDVPTLKVALIQFGRERTTEENRDKIVRLTKQAAAAGVRLVVFPEGALASPPGTPQAEYAASVAAVGRVARENSLYLVTGARFVPEGQVKHHNQLFVFSPEGENLLIYDKVRCARKYDAPKMVSVDGVPCSLIICADRWSRPVESLPPIMAAKIIIVQGSGSAVWDDMEAGNWCAVKIQSGRPWEKVFSAPRIIPGPANPLRQSGYWLTTTPRFRPWMMAGVAAIDSELVAHSAAPP